MTSATCLHGLFVGVDRYDDSRIGDLQFACEDALKFRSLVEQALDPSECSLSTLTNEQATRPAIMKAIGIDLAGAAGPDDVVLIHFSGHGSPELASGIDDLARYLVPHDAAYDNLFGSALDLERDLRAILRRVGSELVFVFIDACFSGVAGGRTFEGPRLRDARRTRRWIPQLPTMSLGAGKVVLAAADDNEVALETSDLGHGVFSSTLLRTLAGEGSPSDRSISVSALYDTVAQRVSDATNGQQNPVMNGYTRLARLPILRPRTAD